MTVNLSTIHPSYNGNHSGSRLRWQHPPGEAPARFPGHSGRLAGKKDTSALPIREFRYNPMRTGEMAEWLKAAVC
jgi:hypothetical protein